MYLLYIINCVHVKMYVYIICIVHNYVVQVIMKELYIEISYLMVRVYTGAEMRRTGNTMVTRVRKTEN